MKRNILMVVDYQYDFVAKNGALSVQDATEIKKEVQQMIDSPFFSQRIISFDTHPSEEIFKQTDEHKIYGFEIHCEFGTKGWEIFGIKTPTQEKFDNFISNNKRIGSGVFSNVEFENDAYFTKDQFDIWAGNKDFPKWVEQNMNTETDTIYIVGVATNYCVFDNAIGFIKKGFKVVIIEDATKGILDDTLEQKTIILKNRGVNFMSTKDIV